MVSQLIGLEEIRQAVGEVCAGRPIMRVDLFGSRAAGTHGASSDVDLLLEFETGAKIGLFELGAIREDLVERLGVQVDILSRKAVESQRYSSTIYFGSGLAPLQAKEERFSSHRSTRIGEDLFPPVGQREETVFLAGVTRAKIILLNLPQSVAKTLSYAQEETHRADCR